MICGEADRLHPTVLYYDEYRTHLSLDRDGRLRTLPTLDPNNRRAPT